MPFPVLLIEDDPDIRALVELTLSLHGIEVVSRAEGRSGLDALATSSFSLVILDLMMPDMSGYEVLQQMKLLLGDAHPPVALFTARPADDIAREAKDLGITHILAKPFEPDKLAAAVRTCMKV